MPRDHRWWWRRTRRPNRSERPADWNSKCFDIYFVRAKKFPSVASEALPISWNIQKKKRGVINNKEREFGICGRCLAHIRASHSVRRAQCAIKWIWSNEHYSLNRPKCVCHWSNCEIDTGNQWQATISRPTRETISITLREWKRLKRLPFKRGGR